MKTKKKYIVLAGFSAGGWRQSLNVGANGEYTKESAERRAKTQARKSRMGIEYRILEVK